LPRISRHPIAPVASLRPVRRGRSCALEHHLTTDPLLALLKATPFQKRVWRALLTIPRGTTLTYGELAKKLNSSPRAIGQACRANPIPFLIPCHRVVGAKDKGGYFGKRTGSKMALKSWLLEQESLNIIT
jgi:methylated-DNA-[protein]-cysteine S-methyltransferase